MDFGNELRHDGIETCDSCESLVYSDDNNCPACGGSIVLTAQEKVLGVGTVREIEQETMMFAVDLRTMAFYTDFLFTKESKAFRYSLMREPI